MNMGDLSNITLITQIKVKKQCFYCCSMNELLSVQD